MLVGNRLKIRVGASSQISMTLDKNLFDVTTILNKADSSNKSPENISFYSNTKQVSKYFFFTYFWTKYKRGQLTKRNSWNYGKKPTLEFRYYIGLLGLIRIYP